MDKVDKAAAMAAWGMASRYHATVIGGWRFVALDLNNFRKDGKVLPYANGNYFNAGSELNRADPEQLAWLDRQLRTSREPVVLIGHQPLGIGGADNALPDEQREIFDLIRAAGRANPRGRVACCLSGHLHVDRLERVDGIPCLTINSASYFWSGGCIPPKPPRLPGLRRRRDPADHWPRRGFVKARHEFGWGGGRSAGSVVGGWC
jgi:hypothetical protein